MPRGAKARGPRVRGKKSPTEADEVSDSEMGTVDPDALAGAPWEDLAGGGSSSGKIKSTAYDDVGDKKKAEKEARKRLEDQRARRKKKLDAFLKSGDPARVSKIREEMRSILQAKLKAKREKQVYEGPEVEDLLSQSDGDSDGEWTKAEVSTKSSRNGKKQRNKVNDDNDDSEEEEDLDEIERRVLSGGSTKSSAKRSSGSSSSSKGEEVSSRGLCGGQIFQILLIAVVMVFLGVLKAGEESFNVGDGPKRSSDEEDFYAILGVSKGVSEIDLKKGYKKLALRWHPDKNLNCEECANKFAKISRAYETLGDKSKRRMYDQTSAVDLESLPSAAVTLTKQNWREKVLDSNGVWVIQTFTEADKNCRNFHQHWEEVVSNSNLAEAVHFGRVHAHEQQELITQLPIAARVHPVVFLYAPSLSAEAVPTFAAQRATPDKLQRWITSHVPVSALFRVQSLADFQAFVGSPGSEAAPSKRRKLLLTMVGTKRASLALKRAAIQWSRLFQIAVVKAEVLKADADLADAVKDLLPAKSDDRQLNLQLPTIAVLGTAEENGVDVSWVAEKVVTFPNTAIKADLLDRALYSFQAEFLAPYLDVTNVELLCRSNSQYRIYCLVEVDSAPASFLGGQHAAEKDQRMGELLARERREYLREVYGATAAGTIDDIFARANSKTTPGGQKPSTSKGKNDDEDGSSDEDSLSAVAGGDEDDVFFIQRAKINVAPDSFAEWVAGRPPRAKYAFTELLNKFFFPSSSSAEAGAEQDGTTDTSSSSSRRFLLIDLDAKRIRGFAAATEADAEKSVQELYMQLEQGSLTFEDFSESFRLDGGFLFAPGVSLFRDVVETLRQYSYLDLALVFAGFLVAYYGATLLDVRLNRPKLSLFVVLSAMLVLLCFLSPATRASYVDFVTTITADTKASARQAYRFLENLVFGRGNIQASKHVDAEI
ncbi:unnamed protein product [Amoebophrya sp. A25]|nr:unnamed protein product [Amoebophrya sp. A25]|eukprot:GSA25T00021665001.1